MIKISVIMPVYNSKNFLGKAVDSVLNQQFNDMELILVDDGSTDGSGKICDDYTLRYDNVKVIHKPNGGICDARNAGLQVASGEYISFIDNDDLFLPGVFEDNYRLAKKYDADVVRFERRKTVIKADGSTYVEKRKGIGCIPGLKDGVACLNRQEMIEHYTSIRRSGALNGIWNGLYRRSIVEEGQVRFDTSIKFGHEDLLFNLRLFDLSEKYVFNDREYYDYFYRYENSTSAKFNINKVESIWKVACAENSMLDTYGKPHREQLENIMGHIFLIVENLNRKACTLSYREKRAYLKSYKDFLKEKGISIKDGFSLFSSSKKEAGLSILLFMGWYRIIFGLIYLYLR